MPLTVLVTGVTGFVDSALVPRLLADGHEVRGFARHAGGVDLGIEIAEGDAATGVGLAAALDGVDVACFLIHAMEGGGDFEDQERAIAERFAAVARRNGVRRVVYLGGLTPADAPASEHLASRRAVEEILLAGFPEAVALRASIVIGDGSRSFDFLAALVERLPAMLLPAWRNGRTRPIDVRDVVEYLACAVTSPAIDGPRTFEIGGADEIAYGDMVLRIAELGGRPRPALGLPFNTTPLASRIAAAVSDEDRGLIEPLMESLEHDLLPDDTAARAIFGVDPRGFDEAVRGALDDRAAAA